MVQDKTLVLQDQDWTLRYAAYCIIFDKCISKASKPVVHYLLHSFCHLLLNWTEATQVQLIINNNSNINNNCAK